MGNEWALVFFTTFVALGAGTFVAIGASEWRAGNTADTAIRLQGGILAIVALAVGGFASVLHLGHVDRIFGALEHPTSGIFTEAVMMGLTGLCVVAYLIAIRKNASGQVRKGIVIVGAVLALLLAFAVGNSYVIPARPAWDSLTLPLVYLGSAVVLGCFGYHVLDARKAGASTTGIMAKVIPGALGLQAVLIVAYLTHLATAPYPNATRSVSRVLMGDLALLFWGGIVLVGLVAPAMLVALKKKTEKIPPFVIAVIGLACVFVGALAFRLMMFSLGTSVWHFF